MTQYWRSKRVLVTGGTGFVGSIVCHKLNERGAARIASPRSVDHDLTRAEDVEKLEDGLRQTLDWYVDNREAAEAATL